MIQVEMMGIKGKPSKMKFRPKQLVVGISNDKMGRSLSIYDEDRDVMYQIPFEQIAPLLERK